MKLGVRRSEMGDHPVGRRLFYLLPFYRLPPFLARAHYRPGHRLQSLFRLEVSGQDCLLEVA